MSSPPGDPGDDDDDSGDDNGGDDNDNASGSGTSPPGSPPPGNSNPHGGIGATLGDVTPPPARCLNEGTSQCPSPRKPIDEEEAIPRNPTKTSWVAYQIADKHPYSTMFERYATSKHSQSIIHFEMLSAFSTR